MVVAGGSRPSALEQRLIDAVVAGTLLDLAGDEPTEEPATRSWGEDRTISASVIRDLARGRLTADTDLRGLRLCGARIDGQIDLEYVTSDL